MLTWRNNAQEIKLHSITKHIPVNSLQKIAVKSIISVLSEKLKKPLNKVLIILNEFKVKPSKIEIPKIEVTFSKHSADRLITFQSAI